MDSKRLLHFFFYNSMFFIIFLILLQSHIFFSFYFDHIFTAYVVTIRLRNRKRGLCQRACTYTRVFTSPEPHILSPLRDQTNRLDYCIINLFTFVVRSVNVYYNFFFTIPCFFLVFFILLQSHIFFSFYFGHIFTTCSYNSFTE